MRFKAKEVNGGKEQIICLELQEVGNNVHLIATNQHGFKKAIMTFSDGKYRKHDCSRLGEGLQCDNDGKILEDYITWE